MALFIAFDSGLSVPGLLGVGLALAFASLGIVSRKFPRVVALFLVLFSGFLIIWLRLYEFQIQRLAMWMVVAVILIAAGCLYLGAQPETNEGGKRSRSIRAIILSTFAAAIVVVFTFLSGSIGGIGKPSPASIAANAVTQVQGISCRGHVTYYPNGVIKMCVLASEDTLAGQPLPEGTTVSFDKDGLKEWCFLPHDTEIQGHLCKGGGHDFQTVFYPNGKLRVAWLGREEVIQDIPIAEYSFSSDVFGGGAGTYFYDNGNLKRAKVATDITVEGRSVTKGQVVVFDENGKLLGVE